MVDEDADPTCPECGESVGAGASHCMHCDAEFIAPVTADTPEAAAEALGLDGSSAGSTSDAADAADEFGTDGDDRGLLHPDGFLDDSLTAVAGIVFGLLVGVFSLFVFAFVTGDVGVILVVFLWLGSTAVLARRRTVFDAVKYGAYALAVVVVLIPAAVALGSSGGLGDRLGAFVVAMIPMGVVAAVLAGVGYLAGRKGVA